MAKKNSPGTVAENRKARHDYNIEDTIEAGIVLQGTEIKKNICSIFSCHKCVNYYHCSICTV